MGRLMDADAEALQKDIPPQLAELAETIGKKANATAVFGSPIVDGDRTVIPVAQARFGLGGGDGLIAKGVGGGMTAKPLASSSSIGTACVFKRRRSRPSPRSRSAW